MVEGERDRDEIHIKDTAGPGDDHISCSVSSFRLTTKEMGKISFHAAIILNKNR